MKPKRKYAAVPEDRKQTVIELLKSKPIRKVAEELELTVGQVYHIISLTKVKKVSKVYFDESVRENWLV